MPQQIVALYHQKWDRPEVLTKESLINVMKLTLKWIGFGGEQDFPNHIESKRMKS